VSNDTDFEKDKWYADQSGKLFQYRGVDVYYGDVTLKFYNPHSKRCFHPYREEAERRFGSGMKQVDNAS